MFGNVILLHCLRVPSYFTLLRFVQFENVFSPIFVILAGMVISVRFIQSENAYFPILVTFFGIITSVSPEHFENVLLLIVVKLSGIQTFVRLVQPRKIKSFVFFVPSEILISVSF